MSGALRVDSLSKRFGKSEAVREVSLAIASGELVVFVGPSGSGKSTLLRMIAGLERPSSGTVRLDGRDITTAGPAKRDMAMVFQSYALYPHMSVAENLAFSLEMAGVEREARRRRVVEVARTLEIEPLLERRPRELSGGQRQRVAIGRAIVREPRVFLFDEPLSNLDAELRVRMRLELSELHTRLSATMVYVTHDQVEAMTLADRIVVLRDGAVEQVGPPISLYNDPDTVFVAGFLGTPRMNLLPARVVGQEGGRCRVHVPALGEEPLPVAPRTPGATASGTITLGIRPERLQVRLDPGSAPSYEVRVVERLGNETHLHLESAGEPITIAVAGQPDVDRGRSVGLGVDPRDCQLFDGDGRRL